jgi:DNA-directed RNA polymerase sigma subunit (sigma70/sigma32)
MALNHGDPRDEYAVMTWKEIGEHLGVSHTRAQQIYLRAVKKLRANPEIMRSCRELAAMLDRERKQVSE